MTIALLVTVLLISAMLVTLVYMTMAVGCDAYDSCLRVHVQHSRSLRS